MNVRRSTIVALPLFLFVVYACSDDSSDTNANIDLDAGPSTLVEGGGTVPVGDSASPATDSGSPVIDSGPPRGPITTCTPVAPLSSKRGGIPANVGTFGGKYLFSYGLQYTDSPDGQSHLLGRYFDGTSFGPEIDFGTDGQTFGSSSVDQTGKEFLNHVRSGGALDRIVFDLTTGTQLPTSTGVGFLGNDRNEAVGGLPRGAFTVYGSRSPTGAIVSRYQNGSWDNDPDAGAGADAGDGGFYTEAKNPDEAGVALNAAGKGALWWLTPTGGTNAQLTVLPYDGTKLGVPTNRTFTANDYLFNAAALSNGDIVFAWVEGNVGDHLAIFHADTGQFDADVALTTTIAPGDGGPLVLVDANDNITALTIGNGFTMRRRIAGTWTADIPIGQSTTSAYGVLDPAGDVLVIAYGEGGVLVTRLSPDATTVGPFVDTGLIGTLQPPVAFNAAGDPVFMSYGPGTDAILKTTICSSSP